jgi:hypothetical protein
MSSVDRLPRRLPVGTRYVVEGVPGDDGELTIVSRTVVLPNGTFLSLPAASHRPAGRKVPRPNKAAAASKRNARTRKSQRV